MKARLLAAALALAGLAAALGVSWRAYARERPALRGSLDAAHMELGESLRLASHPASVNPSYRLPWATVLEADALLRLTPRGVQAWAAFLWLLALGLAFALGRELGGTAAGCAAAGLWAPVLASLPRGPGHLKQFWLTLLGLLAATLLARRAKDPTPGASALAGAGFGLTLLTRGTYAFFPPLLALFDRRRPAALLAGAALAFLLPWTLMNAAAKGRFIPLEDGSMNMNVVTGALGTVFCAHGDYAALMNEAPGAQGFGGPLGWAVKTVLRHPLRYLCGVGGRLSRALALQPFLFLLAAAALLARRRDPAARAAGLQAAYLLAVTCSMSIEDNYFEPLWPLLAALAAAPLAAFPDPAPRLGAALARGVLALSLSLSGLTAARLFALEARYAFAVRSAPPESAAALEAALRREPGSPWLALADARRLLGAGRPSEAASRLAAAPALAGLPRAELLLAFARAQAGDEAALARLEGAGRGAPAPFGDGQAETAALYRAVALEGRRRRPEALKAMGEAAERWAAWQGFLTPGREAAADALTPALKAAAPGRFLVRLDQVFEGQPAGLETALELAARALADGEAWRRLFEARLARGEKEKAAAALWSWSSLARGLRARREVAFAWDKLGRPAEAAAAFSAALAAEGDDARTWSDLGVSLYLAGRRADSVAAFRKALALDPGFKPAADSLAVALSPAKPAPAPR